MIKGDRSKWKTNYLHVYATMHPLPLLPFLTWGGGFTNGLVRRWSGRIQ